MEWTSLSAWLTPLMSVVEDLGEFLPRLFAAFVIFLVGLLAARVSEKLTQGFCRLLKLDRKLERIWLFRPVLQDKVPTAPGRTIAKIVFYTVLIFVILLTLRVLNPDLGGVILTTLGDLLPRTLSFMLIILLGAFIAMFASVISQLVLERSGVQHPQFWGKIVAWGTFCGAVLFSLEQLGIVGKLLSLVVMVLVASLGLGAAIAFGLGCKDMARHFLIELIRGKQKD